MLRKYIILSLIPFICFLQIYQVEAGWPRCNTGCTANDVSIVKLWQASPTICTEGSTTTELWGTFEVNANGRYCPYSVIDIYINGFLYEANHFTWLTTITGSTGDVKLATISYTCGASVELRNIYAQWAASDQGATCPTCKKPATVTPCDCDQAYQPSKCYENAGPIIVPSPLIANFSAYNVCLGNVIQFTDTTSGGYLPYALWKWNFGDGTSSLQNPSHTYTTAGIKTVTLTVTDNMGLTSTSTHYVYVWAQPVADFSYSQICGYNVHFHDLSFAISTGGVGATITGWNWDFNGDNIQDSNLQNPEYTFSSTGTRSVKLTVTDSHGCTNTIIKDVTVNPNNQATASSNSPICEGSTIQLTGGPIGMNNYSWIGPNNYTSNLQSPTISPATSVNDGIYELTITDSSGCQSTATTSISVLLDPLVSMGSDDIICENKESVFLSGINTGGAATYQWTTSGTGTFSAENAISTDYTTSAADKAAGSVTITLTATGTCPGALSSDNVTITILPVPKPSLEVLFP